MGMAFNNLKTLRLRELTGAQFAGVGNIFSDLTSKADFTEIKLIKEAVVNALTFTGGLPFPDSLKNGSAELNNSNITVLPSTVYSTETDSNSFLCKLEAFSATVSGGTSAIQVILTDGSNEVNIAGGSVTASTPLMKQFESVYFNEDVSIKIIEAGSNACDIGYSVSIVSRGGNPQ
jgi:hypothetical protein